MIDNHLIDKNALWFLFSIKVRKKMGETTGFFLILFWLCHIFTIMFILFIKLIILILNIDQILNIVNAYHKCFLKNHIQLNLTLVT